MDKWQEQILNIINHRQRQILVHSIIYYKYNANVVSDYKWSQWAKELYDLMTANQEIAKQSCMYDIFKDFDYSTGADLPLDDEWGNRAAIRLMRSHGIA